MCRWDSPRPDVARCQIVLLASDSRSHSLWRPLCPPRRLSACCPHRRNAGGAGQERRRARGGGPCVRCGQGRGAAAGQGRRPRGERGVSQHGLGPGAGRRDARPAPGHLRRPHRVQGLRFRHPQVRGAATGGTARPARPHPPSQQPLTPASRALQDCGKEFTHTGNFKRHIRIHTGEKPFSCRECSKAFSDPAACKAHEKTHRCGAPAGPSFLLARSW